MHIWRIIMKKFLPTLNAADLLTQAADLSVMCKGKKMIVSEIQKYLSDFNPDAEFKIVVNNRPMPFELAFGSAEGCTKRTADNVAFMVDSTNETTHNNQIKPTKESRAK